VTRWLRSHAVELALFAFGVVLRVSMHFSFDPTTGYDAYQHLDVARLIAERGTIPTPLDTYCGYHPPLYYALLALLTKLGAGPPGFQWLSIAAGIVKLAVIWLGLEWYVKPRAGRIAGLALAVVLPVAVHMDGMLSNEVTSGLFAAVAVVLVPKAFESSGARRWLLTTLLGIVISLQLMSKISALMVVAAIGTGAALELLFAKATPFRARLAKAVPWAMVLLVPLALTGWYFARNVRAYHKPFLSSFDVRPEQIAAMATIEQKPYFQRRPLGFYVGWEPKIFGHPYNDVSLGADARFWSVITAMTFVDYYNFHFSGFGRGVFAQSTVNGRAMTEDIMMASRFSMAGGTALAAAILAAWFACLIIVLRRRQFGFVPLLVLPVLTLVSGAHFAIKYPMDYEGVIKSSYLQFGMVPFFGLFGLAFAWTLERRYRWPLFVILTTGLWFVATYTVYCRLRIPLLPL